MPCRKGIRKANAFLILQNLIARKSLPQNYRLRYVSMGDALGEILGYSDYQLKDLDGFEHAGLCVRRLVLPEGFFIKFSPEECGAKGARDQGFGRHQDLTTVLFGQGLDQAFVLSPTPSQDHFLVEPGPRPDAQRGAQRLDPAGQGRAHLLRGQVPLPGRRDDHPDARDIV